MLPVFFGRLINEWRRDKNPGRKVLVRENKLTVIQSASLWLPQTETWLYNQVRFLPTDIENRVVCEDTQNLDQFPIANLHSPHDLPRWRYVWDKGIRKLGFRPYLYFLVTQARTCGALLLHSHFGNRGWRDTRAARRAGIKHVVTFYGFDVNRLPTVEPRWLERYRELFGNVDCVLCEGPHMARAVAELGCPQRKLRVHHLGVCVDEITFEPRVWSPDEPLRFLIAASFREKKGIPYAIEALGRLQHELSIELTIIGDSSGEPTSEAEKRKILAGLERHNLTSKTRLLGYRRHSDLLKEAYRHHVFLAPSVTASDGDIEGGAPVSIIEMCATGLPVVSTRHCDIPGIIIDGETGLLTGERDSEGLLRQIRRLIEHPENWSELLVAARRHIEKEFNARTQAEKLAAIYRELTAV